MNYVESQKILELLDKMVEGYNKSLREGTLTQKEKAKYLEILERIKEMMHKEQNNDR